MAHTYFTDVSEEWPEKDRLLHVTPTTNWGKYYCVYTLNDCRSTNQRIRFDAQCHADLRTYLNKASYALNGAWHNNDPVGRAYLDFILDPVESPWAKLIAQFKEYKVYDRHNLGLYVYMGGLQHLSFRLVWNFMVAMRGFGEHQQRVRYWHDLVLNHGWDKRKAFAFASCVQANSTNNEGYFYPDPGHWPISQNVYWDRIINQDPVDYDDVLIGMSDLPIDATRYLSINVVWGKDKKGGLYSSNQQKFSQLFDEVILASAPTSSTIRAFFSKKISIDPGSRRQVFNLKSVAKALADKDIGEMMRGIE